MVFFGARSYNGDHFQVTLANNGKTADFNAVVEEPLEA